MTNETHNGDLRALPLSLSGVEGPALPMAILHIRSRANAGAQEAQGTADSLDSGIHQ